MSLESLRAIIRTKLANGSLPHDSILRMWGGAGNGEICDACGIAIERNQFVMEGVSTDDAKRAVQFHVECLYLWDAERVAPGRLDS